MNFEPPRPALPPAGWHDDPHDPTSLRYWDGIAWTEQRAPKFAPASAPAPAVTPSSTWESPRILVAAGAAAVIFGSLMPWVSISTGFGSITKNGIEGDGVITLIAGAVVLVLVFVGKYVGSLIVSALATALLIFEIVDVNRAIDDIDSDFATASVGWGLWLSTVGAVIALIASFIVRRPRANSPSSPIV